MENIALEYYRKLEEEEKRKQTEEEEKKNREEAKETFNRFDSNQDGILDIFELQSRKMFDKDGDGVGKCYQHKTNVITKVSLNSVHFQKSIYRVIQNFLRTICCH